MLWDAGFHICDGCVTYKYPASTRQSIPAWTLSDDGKYPTELPFMLDPAVAD